MTPDFAKIAADLAGDTGLEHVIRAALHETWNAALEEAADIAEREHDHYQNGDAGEYAAEKMRAKKLPPGVR